MLLAWARLQAWAGAQVEPRYWSPKIAGNRARDARNALALAELGWQVLELWECEIRDLKGTEQRIKEFMLS